MNIDEAILVLHEDLGADIYDSHPYLCQALKLGIEALKRIKEGRQKGYDFFGHDLLGETKE